MHGNGHLTTKTWVVSQMTYTLWTYTMHHLLNCLMYKFNEEICDSWVCEVSNIPHILGCTYAYFLFTLNYIFSIFTSTCMTSLFSLQEHMTSLWNHFLFLMIHNNSDPSKYILMHTSENIQCCIVKTTHRPEAEVSFFFQLIYTYVCS